MHFLFLSVVFFIPSPSVPSLPFAGVVGSRIHPIKRVKQCCDVIFGLWVCTETVSSIDFHSFFCF